MAHPNTDTNAGLNQSTTAGVLPTSVKCSQRGCIVSNEIVYRCPGSKCDKALHLSCFQKLHGTKDWFQLVKAGIVCTKKCHQAIKTSIIRKPTWSNDGAGGHDDPQSSERILLDWILTPGNYTNKWRGKDNKGINKRQVAAMIADLINKAGVVVERDAKQVINKIQHLERQFRDAYDFCNTETGQGLQENDPQGFDDAVRKICPYYFDLEDIFGDRASTQPKVLSTDNLDSSDSSSGYDSSEDEDSDDQSSDDIDGYDNGGKDDAAGGLLAGDNPALEGLDLLFSDDEDGNVSTKSNKKVTDKQMPKKDKKRKANKDGGVTRKKQKEVVSDTDAKPVATILDTGTNEMLSALASTKEKLSRTKEQLALATLRKLEREEQVDTEKQRIDLNFFKMRRLKEFRTQFPQMDDDDILEVFPDFKDMIRFVPKPNV